MPFAIGDFVSIGPMSRATFPHRHTFYEIVYLTAGDGVHVVDLAESPLHPPQLCFVQPGQVHFWRATGLDGRVILFTDEFLAAHPGDRETLRQLACGPPLGTPGPDVPAIVEEMQREYAGRGAGRTAILQSLLHILILRAARLAGAASASGPAGGPAAVARGFLALLHQPGGHQRTVQGCARRLGVSASYLNEAVKSVTRRTPGTLIRQAQMLEAKRLLARTDLAVAQIAKQLGFGDPSYFSRFFRREAGMSPGTFRVTAAKHHDHPETSIDGYA
jgi:AraC-like DNA-binding protein